eukprot:m.115655 g.115655  ORF g.115655 m.115655 type:complete len:135 (+) comp14213_c0_seq3:725-1129(+)
MISEYESAHGIEKPTSSKERVEKKKDVNKLVGRKPQKTQATKRKVGVPNPPKKAMKEQQKKEEGKKVEAKDLKEQKVQAADDSDVASARQKIVECYVCEKMINKMECARLGKIGSVVEYYCQPCKIVLDKARQG